MANPMDLDKKYDKAIEQAVLFDDDFSNIALDDIPTMQYILRVILQKYDLEIVDIVTQADNKQFVGKSMRLDFRVIDKNENVYDVEIQNTKNDDLVDRALHNFSAMNLKTVDSGKLYKTTHEKFVIFINSFDYFGTGEAIRTAKLRDDNPSHDCWTNKMHIIMVNGDYRGNDDLGNLLHDFAEKNPENMFCPIIANRVHYFKREKGGRKIMSGMFEKIQQETKEEVAKNLLILNKLSVEEIAKATGLTLEKIKDLAKKINN